MTKKTAEIFLKIFFILQLPSALKREHPALQNTLDPDPESGSNPVPDSKHCSQSQKYY
jgi:hypothetical protein